MSLSLHYVHGWGCDASVWDALAPMLADWPQARGDRGYFGGTDERPPGRSLVVAHSHGALRTLLDPPAGCIGLVAINGFDWLGQGRVLDRMIARFETDPAGVLDAFRTRIGLGAAPSIAGPALLAGDLAHMRNADGRGAHWPHPIIALHGGDDPIVPADIRAAAFEGAPQLKVVPVAGAGHLLPLSHPALCATTIRALAERLA